MGALDGLRVIDLSPTRVGAQVSQLFADHGADVVWVEPPGGSPMRDQPGFPFWARGKQSLVADLRTAAGQAQVRELAEAADVMIETFRPGVIERLGLAYDELAAANPGLVMTSITGFPRTGPYRDVQGYEALVAAKLGVMGIFAPMHRAPHPPFVTVPWFSFSASQVALQGTLAALHERQSSGRGQRVETSLLQAFLSLDTWSWIEYVIASKWPDAFQRTPIYDADGIPTSPFPYFLLIALTKDGHWLQFAQVAPHLFVALMKALGLADMFTDPEWAGMPVFADQEHRRGLWIKMLEAARTKTLAEWQEIFATDPDVFAEPFRSGTSILDHAQLNHDEMVIELHDSERGPVRQPGPLVQMRATPGEPTRSAPRLDEHGDLSGWAPPSAAATPAADTSALPLAGVTILELAVLFAAPHGSTLLADLGARVLKVEALDGDPIRKIITFPESGGAKVMQGKESICIDAHAPEGLAIIHELARRCDVVLQGYRAGAAARMGVDEASLRAVNPDLVYLNAPGYGVGAPAGHRPAYAPSIGAATGVGLTNLGGGGTSDGSIDMAAIMRRSQQLNNATTAANAQSDGFAALGVATALALGVLARARGAGGQEMVTTMLNTGAHAMSAQAVDFTGSTAEPAPGPDFRGLGALYRSYDTSDGWVFLAAPADDEWEPLVAALAGHVDLSADARFADRSSRAANDAGLADVLASVFASRGQLDWERDLLGHGVGCVAVTTKSVEELLDDESFGRASGLLADVEHHTFGDHARMAPLVAFSRSTTRALPGVLAGAHTDLLLAELGYDAVAIADLRERKIVG